MQAPHRPLPPNSLYDQTVILCDQANRIAHNLFPLNVPPNQHHNVSIQHIGNHLLPAKEALFQAQQINFSFMNPPTYLVIATYHDILVSVINYFRHWFPMEQPHPRPPPLQPMRPLNQ